MIYAYYIPLKNEVNKIVYNYSILANCRRKTEGRKETRGKIDKKREMICGVFRKVLSVFGKNAVGTETKSIAVCIVYTIYAKNAKKSE